jgi:O-antigen ligase
VLDWTPPVLLALAWLATAIVPRLVHGAAALAAAAAGIAVLGVWAALRVKSPPSRATWLLIGASFLPLAVVVGSSLRAVNVQVAALGTVGSRVGWVLYLVFWAWFALLALGARRDDLTRVAATVALLGAASGAWALADGLRAGAGVPGLAAVPAGGFATATSAAQFLIVSGGCAIVWFVGSRAPLARFAAGCAGAVALAALVALQSRAAWIGLLAVALTLAALAPLWWRALPMKPSTRWPRIVGIAGAVGLGLVGVVLVGLLAASVGLAGAPASGLAERALPGRTAVWRSAGAAVLAQPVVGRGAAQFTTVSQWRVQQPGDVTTYDLASDAESLPLEWTVSAGVLGLLAVFAALAVLTMQLRLRLLSADKTLAAAIAAATLAGWGVSLWFGLPTPLAGLAAAAVAGTLFAPADASVATPDSVAAPVRRPLPFVVAVALVGCLTAAALVGRLWTPVRIEFAFARAIEAGDSTALSNTLGEGLFKTTDPSFASQSAALLLGGSAADVNLQSSVVPTARMAIERRQADTSWFTPLALAALDVEAVALGDPSSSPDRLASAVEQAQLADRTTGLFAFLAAERARTLGRYDLARALIAQSLQRERTEQALAVARSLGVN